MKRITFAMFTAALVLLLSAQTVMACGGMKSGDAIKSGAPEEVVAE